MKAYLVHDKNRAEPYYTVVFAEKRNKARYLALSTEACEDAEYAGVVATRLPAADSQYNGRTEMDWCNPDDRLFLVKECGFNCAEPEFDDCKNCSAKEYCGEYEHLCEEYCEDGQEET